MDDRPRRPISRLRRQHRRRAVGWWVLALAAVLAAMFVLPALLARLG